MNTLNMTAIAAAISLVFSMSKEAYKAAEDRIATEYTTDKAKCDSLA